MRRLVLAALVFATACSGSNAATVERAAAADDVDALVAHVRAVHPDPWHDVSEQSFTAAAEQLKGRLPSLDSDATLVELMRLVALLGARDGHSGIFPLDSSHRRTLHLYPLRLYAFDDGVRVVAEVGASRGLAGSRVLAIGGRPVAEVADVLRPLVPADNDRSREARLWHWAVVAEVLHGAGVTGDARAATFRLELRDGTVVERSLAPVQAPRYTAAFGDWFHAMVPQGLPRRQRPAFLARRNEPDWTALLARGRVAYAAYNVTLGSSADVAGQLRRLARRRAVRGIVVDIRHNPGGENRAYEELLGALVALGRRERIVVLTSRTTFSAAANFLSDLEARVPVRIVGERSGGSPNLVGDPSGLVLETTGWNVNVGTVWWRKSRAGANDPRLAFEPHVTVPVRWEPLAAGRDTALDAAVGEALR